MSEKAKLTIAFDNQEALDQFARWLCGSGEQQYWEWMEVWEMAEDGPITVTDFNYWADGSDDFMTTNEIIATCGRLTEGDSSDEV